jgi:hypothetical protein
MKVQAPWPLIGTPLDFEMAILGLTGGFFSVTIRMGSNIIPLFVPWPSCATAATSGSIAVIERINLIFMFYFAVHLGPEAL